MTYSWSYVLSWLGFGLSAVSAVLMLCVAATIASSDRNKYYSEEWLSYQVRMHEAASLVHVMFFLCSKPKKRKKNVMFFFSFFLIQ